VYEYEEPPVMFFHRGEWSESYHDDLQQGFVPKPSGSRARAKAIVAWLDKAHQRGGDRIQERERKLASMESPTQIMRRELLAKEMKKKEEKGKKEL
jgi:hypothetical protein